MSVENQVKEGMKSSLDHLMQELKLLRTSRANPGLLDSIYVEVYGTQMKLRDIANITIPESRQLLITPYDANNVSLIGKAIEAANLGLQPIVEGNIVRINVPAMDESARKDIAKQCKKKGEEAKVSIREVRRKHNDLVRKQKSSGDIPEDVMKKHEKMIQDMTEKFCKDVDTICTDKEKDIMAI